MSDSVENAFRKWRVYLALLIGISISGGILVYSFTRTEFHEVEKGKIPITINASITPIRKNFRQLQMGISKKNLLGKYFQTFLGMATPFFG
jgi:hypothetical protein